MKIRLIEPGWTKLTGAFGTTEFKDGVSVEDVSAAEAKHLAGIVQIETLEGANPSATQALLEAHYTPVPVPQMPRADQIAAVQIAKAAPGAIAYTNEQLGAIADKEGIKGIRAIAEPLGLKGNSIADLIDKVLAAQAEAAKKAAADKTTIVDTGVMSDKLLSSPIIVDGAITANKISVGSVVASIATGPAAFTDANLAALAAAAANKSE
jgi:hypothetical protein